MSNHKRTAYILAMDWNSDRAIFSRQVLKQMGFEDIRHGEVTPSHCVGTSNRLSMFNIYDRILDSGDEWAYIFEDDINLVEPISLSEIIQYESISPDHFFYLGCCGLPGTDNIPHSKTSHSINGHQVYNLSPGIVRGSHAIGISKKCIDDVRKKHYETGLVHMDEIYESVIKTHPAVGVRLDLISPARPHHRGIVYQDRIKYPSHWEPGSN